MMLAVLRNKDTLKDMAVASDKMPDLDTDVFMESFASMPMPTWLYTHGTDRRLIGNNAFFEEFGNSLPEFVYTTVANSPRTSSVTYIDAHGERVTKEMIEWPVKCGHKLIGTCACVIGERD